MSRPTTHRYASTLVALDYLEQGPRRKYRLWNACRSSRALGGELDGIGQAPSRYLAELRDRSMCTASLALLHGKDIVYIHRARSSWQGEARLHRESGAVRVYRQVARRWAERC